MVIIYITLRAGHATTLTRQRGNVIVPKQSWLITVCPYSFWLLHLCPKVLTFTVIFLVTEALLCCCVVVVAKLINVSHAQILKFILYSPTQKFKFVVPILGVYFLLTPVRPETGSSLEYAYEVLSAVSSSFQGRHQVLNQILKNWRIRPPKRANLFLTWSKEK